MKTTKTISKKELFLLDMAYKSNLGKTTLSLIQDTNFNYKQKLVFFIAALEEIPNWEQLIINMSFSDKQMLGIIKAVYKGWSVNNLLTIKMKVEDVENELNRLEEESNLNKSSIELIGDKVANEIKSSIGFDSKNTNDEYSI